MGFLDWLTKRKKPLSQLTRTELRRQELMLEKERALLLKRIEKLAREKQAVFERGANEKTPEVRRVLAQEFELKTSEQLLSARQLNIRSKEMMTVSRLRMVRENADRARGAGGKLGLVSEKDILRLGRMIENDSIRTEAYLERLDDILPVGTDGEATGGALSEAGEAVLNIWEEMDRGVLSDRSAAFDEADRQVRRQQAAPEE